ncbi:hypothetical protein V1460_17115 [Streptomyces sp. SCSIO 30461]|uniref:hypothetical protein n=1 Tax=Streptomyces sp. SCSIO 30461 TaxID=3118085 RepID=UPI0030D45E54
MILHHLILDTATLLALSGNRQVSALIHRANLEPEMRLWVPVLAVLQADLENPGTAEHIGQLEVLHTIDLDYPATLAIAQLHRAGTPVGAAAAVHAAKTLPLWDTGALVATVTPDLYDEHSIRIFDLNR